MPPLSATYPVNVFFIVSAGITVRTMQRSSSGSPNFFRHCALVIIDKTLFDFWIVCQVFGEVQVGYGYCIAWDGGVKFDVCRHSSMTKLNSSSHPKNW